MSNCFLFSADRIVPNQNAKVGEFLRMSTATSKISPRVQRISFACAMGSF